MKRFDYCTIIGRDPEIYRSHVANVLQNAGLCRSTWNFHTVIYRNSRISPDITAELAQVAADNDIQVHYYDEVEGTGFETFLHNLYVCWNMCQTVGSTPLNVRAGSDQAFGSDAFKYMLKEWDQFQEDFGHDNVILFHNLIECKERCGASSRHILKDFGSSWKDLDLDAFQAWCDENEAAGLFGWRPANEKWGAPRNQRGLASNDRADGASWIQSKRLFREYGPMPPRYSNNLTGDIGIMERMREHGVEFYIIGNSTTYHISQGERNPQ